MNAKAKSSRMLFKEFIEDKGLLGQRKEFKKEREERRKRFKRSSGLSVEGEEDEDDDPKRSYLIRYFQEFRDQKSRLGLVVALGVLGTLMQATFPWSSKFMIDFVLPRRDLGLLVVCSLLLFLIALSSMLIGLIRDYSCQSLLGNFCAGIKRRMMRRLQQMPLDRLQDLKVGGVISSVQSDTEHLAGLLQRGLLTPLNSLLMFMVGITSLLVLAWEVTLVCLVFCFLVGFVTYLMFQIMRPFWKLMRRDRAEISGRLTEVFSGIEVVRAFSQQSAETRGFSVGTHYLWRKALYGNVIGMLLNRGVWIVFRLVNVAVWLYGGYNMFKGVMSLGDLMAFMALTQWLFRPVQELMGSVTQLQRSLACAERVFDLLDEPLDMVDKSTAVEFKELKNEIRFEHVTFAYPDGTTALHDVDLTIPRGKVTALVGPSGAGKSTITNLVMRFYDVTEGRVMLDGTDVRDLKLANYRKMLSLVLQDVILFDGTVHDNIAYGRPEATMEEIERAARISNCHEFIEELDDGYGSMIGERGVRLSGGQKQRISLARAVLVDPQILILDEATSNLDSESEALIQDALNRIFENRTTIVIAHRLSTIMDADKIIVLDEGKVIEEGTHNELITAKGRYHEMYMTQMQKAETSSKVFNWEEVGSVATA